MLAICSNNHEIIVYTNLFCPLCATLKDYESLKTEMEEIENKNEDLHEQLENTLHEYKKLKTAAKKHAPELLL